MKSLFAMALLWVVAGVLPVHAQNLIYRVKIEPIRTMNLNFYNEGYFVCPVEGGVGSFIFAYKDNGVRSYSIAEGSGRLFFARKNNEIYSVVEAGGPSEDDGESPGTPEEPETPDSVTISASTSASFTAFGEASKDKGFVTALSDFRTVVAPKLNGGSVAWAEEFTSGEEIPDHLGFAGVFDFFLIWEEGRTDDANHRNLSIDEIIAELENELKGQGYKNENPEPEPAPEPEPEPFTGVRVPAGS